MLFRGGTNATPAQMLARFPGGIPVWGRCRFEFDPCSRDYDWLVVYDDLPPAKPGERLSSYVENLACPRSRTLVITTEPSTIKIYGTGYLGQFGHVLTSQEPWVVRHAGAIFSQPALVWFYGRGTELGRYDRLASLEYLPKSRDVSTVCSSKRQRHTLHRQRYDFVQALRIHLPDMDVFGHGVRPISDKAEALDDYRYHIAIENHVGRHHWTEKLSDAFLGFCLPFYHGCPNVADYFPEDSFIPIDLKAPEAVARRIREAIESDEYTRRLPAIREARRLVLEKYGLFATVSRIVEERHDRPVVQDAESSGQIQSRHAWRRKSAMNFLRHASEVARIAIARRFPSLREQNYSAESGRFVK
jgi:Arc/MetJ-type ribon-helix-helix transcriptional regulator